MWRRLIVLGLTVTTVTGAEARGIRITFRPRLFTLRPPLSRPVERKTTPTLFRRERETSPSASILDASHEAVAPASAKAATAKALDQSLDRSSHWCDNGQIVGAGTGFCVLNIGAGAPT